MSSIDYDSIDTAFFVEKENEIFSNEDINVDYLPTDTCTTFADSFQKEDNEYYEHFEDQTQIVFEKNERLKSSNDQL